MDAYETAKVGLFKCHQKQTRERVCVFLHPFSISFRSQFVLALSKLLLPWKLLECTNNIFPLRDRKQPETSPYKASSCFLAEC